jgi:thiosulfate/3-mercaptopyruvate sulfurtransferase
MPAMARQPEERIGSPARPLISIAELAALIDNLPPGVAHDPRLRLVDVRWYLGQPGKGREAYEAGHIPQAIFLDLDEDLSDLGGLGSPGRHPLPAPEAFAARLGAAGIGDDSLVVAYDDAGGWVASRLWWMLDNLGHNRRPGASGAAAVLDGGWRAWEAAGLPVSRETPSFSPDELHLGERWTNVIVRDELHGRLGDVTLLDARAAPRYRGETEPVDPVAGHIPTAVSAPWDANLGGDGRLLGPAALRDAYATLGVATDTSDPGDAGDGGDAAARHVVTSCGSGTSACHHSLAMRVAGLPDPTLYVGSYSDWSRSGMPVATGPEPGAPPE